MKNVFILSNASTYGGGERSLEAILPHLAERFRLTVFVENQRHREHVARLAAGSHLTVRQLAGGGGTMALLRDFSVVRRALQSVRPGALVANANKAALMAALSRVTIATPPPALFFVRDFQWRNRKTILRLARGPRIVVPSLAVAEHVFWADLLAEYPYTVIPNAVADAGPICDSAVAGRTVLCLANFGRWKGLHLLIRAFARCAPRRHGMRLVFAGQPHDTAYLEECQALVRDYGLADLVTFAPFADAPGPLYRECAMVVVASISKYGGPETFSRTVIEAWAHGRPVISFAVGGPRYLIRDGIDGFLVAEGDIDALAEKMKLLWADRGLASRLGAAGYARAQTEFSTAGIAARVGDELAAMMGEG